LDYGAGLSTFKRTLWSDPLALHQVEPNIIYAGLRGGVATIEDLRVDKQSNNILDAVSRPTGKAIVGVKRLNDGAVPWGLVVSKMKDEVSVPQVLAHTIDAIV
jgi:WD repeat-containing protein 21A